MATAINPSIALIDPTSSLYSTYMSLYNMFFNAQDSGTVIADSDIDIKLKNSAYGFAIVIDNGGGGGGSNEYLLKSGGDLFGLLRANYGFEGGIDNHRIANFFKEAVLDEIGNIASYKYGLNIEGDIRVGGQGLFIDGENIIQYNQNTGKLIFHPGDSSIFNGSVGFNTDILIGNELGSGVFIDPSGIKVNNNIAYHAGNSNLSTVDWTAKNLNVHGSLEVKLSSMFLGNIEAINGASLGYAGVEYVSINSDRLVSFNANLNFGTNYGVKIGAHPVLMRYGDYGVELNAAGGDLFLGNQSTLKTRMMTNLSDNTGNKIVMTSHGGISAWDYFKARHNNSDVLLETYQNNNVLADTGVAINKMIKFGVDGPRFYANGYQLNVLSKTLYQQNEATPAHINEHITSLQTLPSVSYYKELNRDSDSVFFNTSADFYVFNKQIDSVNGFGISGSPTKLTSNALFFTNESYLLHVTGGIKHYGNAYFLGDISSESFASGFSGYGWALRHNITTGNYALTTDELTVRKKMRVYELEVQTIKGTNGALWISDSCSGDSVEKL